MLNVMSKCDGADTLTREEKFQVFCRVCDNMLGDGRITKANHLAGLTSGNGTSSDFTHEPPENYTYEVKEFRRNILSIWCAIMLNSLTTAVLLQKLFGDSTMSNNAPTSLPSIVRNQANGKHQQYYPIYSDATEQGFGESMDVTVP